MLKKKKWIYLLLSGILALALTACAGAPAASSGTPAPATSTTDATSAPESAAPVHISIGRVGTGLGGLDAAYLNGDFLAAGLDVERISFSAGSDGIAALVSGDLDLMLASYEHVVRQIEKGIDVKAFAMIANKQSYVLLTKTDAPYDSLEDLKGANIGVTKVGSQSDSVLRKILRGAGVDPETEVSIINGGTGATIAAALQSGSVDAAMVSDPTLSQLLSTGEYRVLHDPDYETAGLVILGRTQWAQEHADALKTLLQVISDESKQIAAAPDAYVEVFKPDYPDYADEVLSLAITNDAKRVPTGLILTQAAVDEVEETQLAQGTIQAKHPLSETYVDAYLPN